MKYQYFYNYDDYIGNVFVICGKNWKSDQDIFHFNSNTFISIIINIKGLKRKY